MSRICPQRMSRRQLLKGGVALAAGALTFGSPSVFAEGRDECTRWAFLSDTHIAADPDDHFRGFHPYRNLREITGQLACDLPQGIVVAGDLARLEGDLQAYANFKTLLAPMAQKRPVYLGLGNHDSRENFFEAYWQPGSSKEAVDDKHVVVANGGPVRFIILDTLYHVNTTPGLLGGPQLTWLGGFLRMCGDKPTILFLHHTPNADLRDAEPLFRIIGPMAKVKAVVYGHNHHFGFSQYKGIHLINVPATGFNLSDGHPVGWMEATLTAAGGEFRLHAIGGNARLDGLTTKLLWRA
jgi:Icc protein